MLRHVIHYALHFLAPALVARFAFREQFLRAWMIMVATMVIDLDHLLVTPIFDPDRCGIGLHPLHSYLAIAVYVVLLVPRTTRIVGCGLLLHIFADWLDCVWQRLA